MTVSLSLLFPASLINPDDRFIDACPTYKDDIEEKVAFSVIVYGK